MVEVTIARRAQRQLRRTPKRIVHKLQAWIDLVEALGLRKVRMMKGYHDEPLRGERAGQRSVRLGRQWRVIYTEDDTGTATIVTVEEVTPHAY